MKRKFLYLIAVLIILTQISSCALAKSTSISNPVKIAIKKYKTGNYTGCLQDCQAIIGREPSNALAYYYMAMSYVQAGKKNEAINSYSKVLSLNPKPKLLEYAATGKRCLETPDKCHLDTPASGDNSELDKFIASPYMDGLSGDVRKDFEQKRLDGIRNEINSDKDINSYEFKKINYSPEQSTQTEVKKEEAVQKKPTDDEIAAALKVLNNAGLNPYAQQAQAAAAINPYAQASNCQNPEQMQLNMLMGGNNRINDGNTMLNMLPFMAAQNKDSTSNYYPQLMQAVIMNSMMTDFNFNTDKDK